MFNCCNMSVLELSCTYTHTMTAPPHTHTPHTHLPNTHTPHTHTTHTHTLWQRPPLPHTHTPTTSAGIHVCKLVPAHSPLQILTIICMWVSIPPRVDKSIYHWYLIAGNCRGSNFVSHISQKILALKSTIQVLEAITLLHVVCIVWWFCGNDKDFRAPTPTHTHHTHPTHTHTHTHTTILTNALC